MSEDIIIYADILFLLNFALDFICLFITSRLLARKAKVLRLAAGSVIGGLYSVAYVAISDLNVLLLLSVSLSAAAIICFVSFGFKSAADMLKVLAVYIFSSAVLGGVISGMLSLFGQHNMDIGAPVLLLAAVISGGIALIYSLFAKRRMMVQSAEATVVYRGITLSPSLLVDSGNLLSDPYTGLPVIILSYRLFTDIGSLPLRIVPITTASGDSFVSAFTPDMITVNGCDVEAVIAIDSKNKSFASYDGIVPVCLIHKRKETKQ